jgi:Acetoacetate decarboxylase (ADC)
VSYPPQPWHLRGQLYLSIWAVPRAALPTLPVEPDARPLLFAGRALVGAAFVRYEPGGVLQYRELLAAVLVRQRRPRRPRVSIMDIWVDSVASRDGGRELWGIPKDLADLVVDAGPHRAAVDGADIAAARFTRGLRLPGRWPVPMAVSQRLAGTVVTTKVRGTAALRLGRATWTAEAGGPLRYLAGRRPFLTLTIADFRLRFGDVQSDSVD